MVLLELMLSFRKVLGNDINIDGWVTDPRTPQTNCSQCNKGKDIIAASSLIVRFQIVCLNKISCVPLDTSRLICCHAEVLYPEYKKEKEKKKGGSTMVDKG